MRVLMVGVGIAFLSACGGSSSSGPGSPGTTGAASAHTGSASGSQEVIVNACSVITQGEAGSLLTTKVTSESKAGTCTWTGSSAATLNVAVFPVGPGVSTLVRHQTCSGLSGSLSGIGTAAGYCVSSGALPEPRVSFSKNGLLVVITCVPDCDRDRLVAAARTGASRI